MPVVWRGRQQRHSEMTTKQLTITLPELADGERYLCGVIDENGAVAHTVLLPGDADPAPWEAQIAWAKSIGGDLLSRTEQAIAFASMPEEFKRDWYWSNQQHASASGYAWSQYFDGGHQHGTRKYNELRARAVRRLVIDSPPAIGRSALRPVFLLALAVAGAWLFSRGLRSARGCAPPCC